MSKAWYVVHTYSGFENKAKAALEERIKQLGVSQRFGDILIPTEQVIEVKGGQKRSVTRKFFPGYILVQMELDNLTWHVVKETPKITGFVGGTRNPPPVPDIIAECVLLGVPGAIVISAGFKENGAEGATHSGTPLIPSVDGTTGTMIGAMGSFFAYT